MAFIMDKKHRGKFYSDNLDFHFTIPFQ